MKVLVAAEGDTLDSPVARRFGTAARYLVVDLENFRLDILKEFDVKDHRAIMDKAMEWGAGTIIAGNVGPRFYDLISSTGAQFALAANLTVREAVERYLRGTLRILDAPTIQRSIEEHEIMLRDRRRQFAAQRRRGMFGPGSGNARGRHHLQQYGGRGH